MGSYTGNVGTCHWSAGNIGMPLVSRQGGDEVHLARVRHIPSIHGKLHGELGAALIGRLLGVGWWGGLGLSVARYLNVVRSKVLGPMLEFVPGST